MLGIELQSECQPLYLSTLCLPLIELNEYNIKVKQANKQTRETQVCCWKKVGSKK